MSPSTKLFILRLLSKPYLFDLTVIVVGWLTGTLLWFSVAQALPLSSLQNLWQSAHEPQTLFQWLIHPIAPWDWLSIGFINGVATLSLWLFCRIALLIGISPSTTFVLFLLLNFNPEYNDARLSVNAFQPVLVLWLLSVWLFLSNYQHHLYRAFFAWAATLWLATLFSPYGLVWALGFPLCFMFWPGGYFWRQRIYERGKFILSYYAIIIAIVVFIPRLRDYVQHSFFALAERFYFIVEELSLFLSDDSNFSLSGIDGFVIALVLVSLNAARVTGLVILFFVWQGVRRARQTVLSGNVRLFFAFCLVFAWIYAALSLLYYGTFQNDLIYMPITMLVLWLSSPGVFYTLDRFRYGHIRTERQLVIIWLFVAYALASIITFGPSRDYKRAAGLWAQTQTFKQIYSNDKEPLYHAGYSPMHDAYYHHFFIESDDPLQKGVDKNDLILHRQGRHDQAATQLTDYNIVAEFSNRRGDKIYALRLKR